MKSRISGFKFDVLRTTARPHTMEQLHDGEIADAGEREPLFSCFHIQTTQH
jgi:hypothetical protein